MGKKADFFSLLSFLVLILTITFLFANNSRKIKGEFKKAAYKDSCASILASELWQCYGNNEQLADYRIRKLRNFLFKYNSPLARYAYVFIEEADKYSLDWRLLPAIAGVESTFGRAIPYQSFNAYGWNNGNYYFEGWSESISHVTKALAEHYVAKGARTIEQIAPIYNPVTPIFWGNKVKYFMKAIDKGHFKTSFVESIAL